MRYCRSTCKIPTHGLSITPYEKRVAELDMIRRKRREEKEKQQLKNQEYAVSQILQIPSVTSCKQEEYVKTASPLISLIPSRNYPLDKQPKQPSILFDKLKIRPKPLSLQNPKCELTPVVILPSTSSSRNFDTVSSTNTLVEMMTNPSSDQDQFVLSVPTSTPKDVVRQEDQIRTTKTVYQYDNKTEQCLTPAKNLPKQRHNSFSQNISIHYNVTPKKTSNITSPSSNSFPTTRVQTNTARSMKKKKIILKPKYTIKSSVHKESYSKTNNSYSLSRKRNIDTGSSSSSTSSSSSSSSSEGEDNFHELRIYKDKGSDEPVLTDSMHKCDVSTPIGYNSKVFSEGQKFNKSISTCYTDISDCSSLRTGLFEENSSRSQVSLFSCTPLSKLENTAKRLQSPRTYQHESNTMIRKRARSAILSNLSPRFGDKLFNESKYDS